METIRIAQPNVGERERTQVMAALDNAHLSGISPIVRVFETEFARRTGRKYAVSCNSGSSALLLALLALKPQRLRIPAFCYIAIPNACEAARVPFELTDCDEYGNIKAGGNDVLAVHTYGHQFKGRCLIEDAAEAIGMQTNRSKITCFSFFANKTMTTGEGGMCTTDSPMLYKRLLGLRDHWNTRKGLKRYYSDDMGYSMAMGGLQAALGYAQVQRLDEFLKIKERIVNTYDTLLFGECNMGTCIERFGGLWMYGILANNARTRDRLMKFMAQNGVETRNFFPTVDKQKVFVDGKYSCASESDYGNTFPKSYELANRGVYLPSGTTLTEEQQKIVCNLIRKFSYYEH
jgi:perosamine synthetase